MTNEAALDVLKEAAVRMQGNEILYRAICVAIPAVEKQIPRKPRETRCALMCANCGHKITEKGCKKLNRLYCKKCGQAIDWSGSNG